MNRSEYSPDGVLERPRGNEVMVLVVGEEVLDHNVEDGPRVRDGDLLAGLGLDDVVLGERGRQHAPNAVGVELERPADALDNLARTRDDGGAGVANDARHLHGEPARPAAHHVAVKGVQDALVGQLQRVVQHCLRVRHLGLNIG